MIHILKFIIGIAIIAIVVILPLPIFLLTWNWKEYYMLVVVVTELINEYVFIKK